MRAGWLQRYEGTLWAATLGLITVAGCLLRLNRIGMESIDLEEYACLGSLDAANLWEFIKEQRRLYPFGAPTVPTLFYLWSGIAGDGIVAMRVLVVAFGTALIPVVYVAGRVFTGSRWAGLTGAVLTALSPAYVYQGQEARMYAFLTLGAVLSCVALLRMQETGARGWRRLHYLANFVVIWSHLFGVLLVAAQGLWLLWVWRRQWRRLFHWSAVHAAIAMPVALWTLGVAEAGSTLYSYYSPPGIRQLRDDLLKDDVVYGSTVAWWPTPRERSPWGEWHNAIHGAHHYTDIVLQVLMAAGLAWWLWKTLAARRDAQRLQQHVLLWLWALGPITVLFVLSYLWQPVYSSRYSGYGAIAQYIMVGAVVAALPMRSVRSFALVLLMGLYVHQLAMSLPGPMRTEWREMLAKIEADSLGDEPVLVEDPFWLQVIEANRHEHRRVVEGAFERESLCDIAAVCANELGGAWVLLVDLRAEGPEMTGQCLESRGMQAEVTRYYGERPCYLIKVVPKKLETRACAPGRVMTELTGALASAANRREIPVQYNERLRFEPDARAGAWLRTAVSLLKVGRPEAACELFARAEEVWPAVVESASHSRVAAP